MLTGIYTTPGTSGARTAVADATATSRCLLRVLWLSAALITAPPADAAYESDVRNGWKTIHIFVGNHSYRVKNRLTHRVLAPEQDRWVTPGLQLGAPGSGLADEDHPAWQESKSQSFQDEYIIALHKRKQFGFYIDLAANDAVGISNTVVLDKKYGWSGLCIEPNPKYWWGLAHRSCRVVSAVLSDRTNSTIDMQFTGGLGHIINDGKVSQKYQHKKEENSHKPARTDSVDSRPTIDIPAMLEYAGDVPSTIDYMSLDVEGAEDMVIEAFPFATHTIMSMSVERPSKYVQEQLWRNGLRAVIKAGSYGDVLYIHESFPGGFEEAKKRIYARHQELCEMLKGLPPDMLTASTSYVASFCTRFQPKEHMAYEKELATRLLAT